MYAPVMAYCKTYIFIAASTWRIDKCDLCNFAPSDNLAITAVSRPVILYALTFAFLLSDMYWH